MVDLYRFVVVAIVFAVVYAVCLKWIATWMGRRLGILKRTDAPRTSRLAHTARIATLCIGGLGVIALGWGFIEPYFPRVETVRIPTDKLIAPIRIVHISDLHSDAAVRAEDRVVETVRALAPDLIVFTGDGVNSDAGIPVFRRTMKALSKIAPLYGVRGNWEVWWFTHVDSFAGSGIRELNGDAVPIEVRGQTVWLGGVAVDHEHRLKRMLRQMPKDAFRLVLHHYPVASTRLDGRADLLLSGDTHGGQIRLPLIGPLVRVVRWGGDFYYSGRHRAPKGLWYYVNRGIGMEGHGVPRVRFNCPPEITLIHLTPA